MRSSKLLNSLVGTPGQLESDVNTSTLVGDSLVGLKGNSSGSSLREDGNKLSPVLKVGAFLHIDHVETPFALPTLISDHLLAGDPVRLLNLSLQREIRVERAKY